MVHVNDDTFYHTNHLEFENRDIFREILRTYLYTSSAQHLTFLMPNDCFSFPYLLYDKLIFKLSVSVKIEGKKDELIRIFNGFELLRAFIDPRCSPFSARPKRERNTTCSKAIILMSVQHYVRLHNVRSNKVR